MRTSLALVLVLGVCLSTTRGADDPKAVVEKSVKALGGVEKLSKYGGARTHHKGKLEIMGFSTDYTGEMIYQYPDQFKMDLTMEIMGQKIELIQIYNKGKGYLKVMGMVQDLGGDQLDSLKNEVYANGVEALYPLVNDKEKLYTFALIGEEKINDKATLGVRVSSKDRKDINLYFDKESGLLVKSSRRATDFSGANEVTQDTYYSDYKEVSGVKQPMKFLVHHDGKKVIEGEITEVKLVEKIEDSEFAKP
jgi:hypothetical protein